MFVGIYLSNQSEQVGGNKLMERTYYGDVFLQGISSALVLFHPSVSSFLPPILEVTFPVSLGLPKHINTGN